MMIETVHDLMGRKTDAVSSSMQTSDRFVRNKETRVQQLLPGIPDDITLALVVPKLSWQTFYVLSSVNQAWKRAIQSGKVYDARVRAEGTETLVVIDFIMIVPGNFALGLYSGNDKSVHKLPPIPNFRRGLPRLSKCISLDGKIYVIGGQRELSAIPVSNYGELPHGFDHGPSLDSVYVLDLARQRPWEQCKSMGCARKSFGIGVVGGKIYVLGGVSYSAGPAVTVSEVYDPVYNTWHPFESMLNSRVSQRHVLTIGEELIIHGGWWSPQYEMKKSGLGRSDDADHINSAGESADFLEIYHPGKNAWRTVTPFDSNIDLFIHQGQLHSICWSGIDVYDIDEEAWIEKCSYSHAGSPSFLLAGDMLVVLRSYAPDDDDGQDPARELCTLGSSALVSGNELVAAVQWSGSRGHLGRALICSIGFGKQETIEWQKVDCSFRMTTATSICPLQL